MRCVHRGTFEEDEQEGYLQEGVATNEAFDLTCINYKASKWMV